MTELCFRGPFTLLTAPPGAGVYLWTVRQSDGSHLIHFIGEAADCARRQAEHVIQILGGNYGISDVEQARAGRLVWTWPGLWRDHSLPRLLDAYPGFGAKGYLEALGLFFAPVEGDRNLRRHIEGCLAHHLRASGAPHLYPADNRTGRSKTLRIELRVTAPQRVLGLPGTASGTTQHRE